MRYHTAARDEQAATTGTSFKPEDYVIFELRDIRSGPIDEIAARPLAELVTGPTEEVLRVTVHHLQYGKGPKHSCYDVAWNSDPSAAPYQDKLSVAEMLASGGDRLSDIVRYTSFEVTIRLAGKERTYRGIALYHSRAESSGKLRAEILDNITPEMNAVLADESPRVRSPWKTYVKSGLYLAVSEQVSKTEKAGKPLIPADAPIGYLPGDDVIPRNTEKASITVTCPAPTVSITFNQSGVPLCGGSPPPPGAAGYVCSVAMTAQGNPSGGSYSWSTSSNKVTLSQTTSQTVTVIGQSESDSVGDVVVVVTYTVNQQPVTAQVQTTVQKPTYMGFVSIDFNRAKADCLAGQAGWEKGITWQAQDRFNQPIRFEMAAWDTINNNTPNTCSVPAQGEGTLPQVGATTDADGKWSHHYGLCSSACVNGNCQVTGTQKYFINGFEIDLGFMMKCGRITVDGH